MSTTTALPASETQAVALLEPCFLDLITAIEQAKDLPEQTRRQWACSVRQIAKWLGRPAAAVPARWPAVRIPVAQLHHARVGVTSKTLANHRSNVRAALRWFGKEQGVPQRGARLSPEWARFLQQLERSIRQRLYNLARYCSARGTGPNSVDDTLFDEYWRHRAENTGRATNNTAKRFMVRAWNGCLAAMDGPPLQRLTEPPIKSAEPAWEKFPAGLRRDIDDYLAGLSRPHRTLNGQRIQPCRPSTIAYRRAELVAFCRTAVKLGVPIESLNCLGSLLHPDVAERVLDYYWRKNGDEPKTGTIDLGWKILRMAQRTGCLDQSALDRLDDMRAALQQHRREGMTPKNLQLIRQVLTEGVWSEVVSLPKALMRQARLAKDHAPIKAAVMAQLAVAIAIETFAPIRLRNLISIELGKNLIKPGGLNTPYWLVFPNYDVKNRVDLNFKFDEPLTDLIAEYVDEYRPILLRGANSNWLFPGENGEAKNGLLFSKQITERIQKAVGLRITVHQFRHAAAAIYLKHHPGNYEAVRRVLGHRSLATTVKFYCGLETIAASEQFRRLIRERIEFDDETDA
ncbi:MAG: tyrosine-type recombinase/integrase [Xanthobacteraceae bacterium]